MRGIHEGKTGAAIVHPASLRKSRRDKVGVMLTSYSPQKIRRAQRRENREGAKIAKAFYFFNRNLCVLCVFAVKSPLRVLDALCGEELTQLKVRRT
jgi:hypothetical protein